MNRIIRYSFLLLYLLALQGCRSQSGEEKRIVLPKPVDRLPSVAGQFYPSDREELYRTLSSFFAAAQPRRTGRTLLALIAPHAGYVYSGGVAASAFNQIDSGAAYDNIFLLGPSHQVPFDGASIYTRGNFVTPLGTVAVNRELGEELIKRAAVFSDRVDAHQREHSLEVQLPFLQHRLRNDFRIVPIVVGASSPETCYRIAGALRPHLRPGNLFVVSTDFSHYPPYDDASLIDKGTADALCANSAAKLIRVIGENERKQVRNLATSMCGVAGALTLLYMTEKNPHLSFDIIEYKNSGDIRAAGKEGVVGYFAIAVTTDEKQQPRDFHLNDGDKKRLLAFAREAITGFVVKGKLSELDTTTVSAAMMERCGVFVTIRRDKQLRGCIGRFESSLPLCKLVQEIAISSATRDTRFYPVEAEELQEIDIEISVLTPMRRIAGIEEIEMGKHGIYIRKGMSSGTFLPQVARETGWSREEFLGHCAQDKAGIGWNGWKDAEIYVYEALEFGEKQRKE